MSPAKLEQLLQEALAHHSAGNFAQAETLYGEARASFPRHFDVLHLSGTLALQQNRHTEAIEWLGRALLLNMRSGVCTMRLALAYAAVGRLDEAEKNLRIALRRQPDLSEAWDNLGCVLNTRGRLSEAVPCHERAVALKPERVFGWYNLGMTLRQAGRVTEALAAHDQGLRLAPQMAGLHYGRGLALQQAYRLKESMAAFDAAIELNPDHHAARSGRLVTMGSAGRVPAEQLCAAYKAYGAAFTDTPPASGEGNAVAAKLRVAFLSPGFRTSSTACFAEPLIRRLDRAQFDVLLYHDHPAVDELSLRFKSLAQVWRNFAGLSDDAVETLVRADRPDILINLAGHTLFNRLPLLARRLAPVQLGWLGDPHTTGLAAMDGRITDEITDPAGDADAWYTEELMRPTPTAMVYQPPADSPTINAAPPCLTNGYATFGCFNDFSKVSDELLAAWARLLRAVPKSRLRIKTAGVSEPLIAGFIRERLRALDVADERLELVERVPTVHGHLSLHQDVDVMLDTFPFHGTSSTCDALWMGVPVITLAGAYPAARVGAGLLQAAGRAGWIAQDWNSYVDLAAGLARDPVELATQREKLRADLARSDLLDFSTQAAGFSSALRECWQARGRAALTAAVA